MIVDNKPGAGTFLRIGHQFGDVVVRRRSLRYQHGGRFHHLRQRREVVVTSPEMVKLIEQQGAQPSGASGAEFAKIVRNDHDRWGEVIRAAKIKLD